MYSDFSDLSRGSRVWFAFDGSVYTGIIEIELDCDQEYYIKFDPCFSAPERLAYVHMDDILDVKGERDTKKKSGGLTRFLEKHNV